MQILNLNDAIRHFCHTFQIENPQIAYKNKNKHVLINNSFYIKFTRLTFENFSYFCKETERTEKGETINAEVIDNLYLATEIEDIYFIYPNGTILQGKIRDFLLDGIQRETQNGEWTLSIPLRWLEVILDGKGNHGKSRQVLSKEQSKRKKQITLNSL